MALGKSLNLAPCLSFPHLRTGTPILTCLWGRGEGAWRNPLTLVKHLADERC